MKPVGFGALSPLIQNTPVAPASAEFEAQADRAIASLPGFVQKTLQNNGIKVVIAKFLTDAFPHLKGVVPRGWDPWTTWDNSDALCATPLIGLGEFSWANTVSRPSKFSKMQLVPRRVRVTPEVSKPNNILVRNVATEQVLRHETGHAVDDVLRRVSETDAFERAYHQDLNRMSPDEKDRFYYYIQPDAASLPTKAGHSEAFAEAFAALYGGGCNVPAPFKKHFKSLMAFTDQLMKRLEKSMTPVSSPAPDTSEAA